MSPEMITMFSLPESDSDLPFFSPDPDHNEEEAISDPNSPPNPASSSDQNPKLPPNQEAEFDVTGGSSPSHEVNRNPCTTNQNKEPVENVESCTNQNEEPVGNDNPCTNQNEEPLRRPETLFGSHSHGLNKQPLVSCLEGGAKRTTEIEKVGTVVTSAVPRKLPTWASNQTDENGKGRNGNAVTEKKGNDFPLPLPQNFQQVVEAFTAGFDEKKYADMDLLEIAEMKGIVFDNPSWWPAEGFPDSLDQGNAGTASGR